MADEKDREIQYLRREIDALTKRTIELSEENIKAFGEGWKKGAAALARKVIDLCEVWTIWDTEEQEHDSETISNTAPENTD